MGPLGSQPREDQAHASHRASPQSTTAVETALCPQTASQLSGVSPSSTQFSRHKHVASNGQTSSSAQQLAFAHVTHASSCGSGSQMLGVPPSSVLPLAPVPSVAVSVSLALPVPLALAVSLALS